MVKAVIIGAGPAGLTAAYELTKNNVRTTVIEQNNYVGGISQTSNYKGYHFDMGGHRFFSKSNEINKLWDEMLPDGFINVNRLSRIYYNKKFLNYPIKLGDVLFKLGLIKSMQIGFSYLFTKLKPRKKDDSFENWIVNRFGNALYKQYFKDYTEKVWNIPCTEISSDWAAQRIKGASFVRTVLNAVFPKKNVKSWIETFKYPRLGPGMLWENVAEKINKENEIVLNSKVSSIKWKGDKVVSITAGNKEYNADYFMSTMPIREMINSLSPRAPANVINAANSLQYRDFLIVALIIEQENPFPDNWIYIHDPAFKVGRIQNYGQWSREMLADPSKSCLGMEYFCNENDSLWKMHNNDLIELAKTEIGMLKLALPSKVVDGTVIRVPKAYPVYNLKYKENIAIVREFVDKNLTNLQLIGRNGMHKYNNQDHSMMTGLLAARNILGAKFDVWNVNADAEYHELQKSSFFSYRK
jgi:protoporphyrinogen oxidase